MKTNKRCFFSSDRKREKKRNRNHTNKHHLVNRCNGGTSTPSNLLTIDVYRHRAWHELFRNLNLDEVIELLIRLKNLKSLQR